MEFGQKQLDYLFIVLGIIMLLLVGCMKTPEGLDFVSDAVRGFTSLAGILGGFTTFLFSNMIGSAETKQKKDYLTNKIKTTALFLFIGFALIMMAYRNLVDNHLNFSFAYALGGMFVIMLVFLRAVLLLDLEEKDLQ